jgi:hypothetical protein
MPILDGRTVLFGGSKGFANDDIMAPLEHALGTGTLDPLRLLAHGTPHHCRPGNGSASIVQGKAQIGRLFTTNESGECVWSLHHHNTSCCGNMSCGLPQYLASNTMLPMNESDVPPGLREVQFPTKKATGPYDLLATAPSGGCRDDPGPASATLHCARSSSPSWVAWRWYRFVDQPGLQQVLRNRSSTERDFLQQRVTTLHKMMPTRTSRWIKAGKAIAAQGRIKIDSAAIISSPPVGLEHGYVPISLYEGLDRPEGCDVVHGRNEQEAPPLASTRRANTRRASTNTTIGTAGVSTFDLPAWDISKPACRPAPLAKTCGGRCLQNGHCCVGTVSNDGRPSCAQGCIIANYTASLGDCQQYCRGLAAMHNCTWTIGGHHMTSCGPANCPPECSAFDGPYECEAGCEFSRQLRRV